MGERPPVRRASSFLLQLAGIAAVLLARGCSHDWGSYDPRLGSSSGAGGSASSSAMSSGDGTSATSSSSGGGGGAGGAGAGGMTSSSATSSSTSSTAASTSAMSSSASGVMICAPNATQPCYDGPVGTKNHAPCKAGTQTCDPTGMFWGACMNEVTPVVEDCATAEDDDCNSTPNDHCGLWSKRFGGAGDQKPWALAVAGDGHLAITGQAFASVDFGGGPLTDAGLGDLFVTVLDSTGAHVWSRIFGDASPQIGNGVAIDAAGNVYVTGAFQGTMDFGAAGPPAIVSAGEDDIFVLKLDPSGTPLWARSFGDASPQKGNAIAVDAGGTVYVAGDFQGTVDFGDGPKTAQSANGVLLALDPTGVVLGNYTFGGSGNDAATSLAVASSGHVIVGGYFTSKAVFGGTTLTSVGGADVFVAEMTPAGGTIWAHGYGSAGTEASGAVGVDAAGNVFFDGILGGSVNFGCGAVANVGPKDLFLVKLDSAGQCAWSKGYGDPVDGSQGARLAVDGAGNALVTFEFVGTADFGGGPMTTGNPHDILVLKVDPTGKYLWARKFGDSGDQDGRGIGADSAGNVYVVGEMAGSVNFGSGPLASAGGDDICVAKLSP